MRFVDIQYLSFAMKLLLAGYAADLLFGEVHLSIYLHHIFTFALLLVGQLAVFHAGSECHDFSVLLLSSDADPRATAPKFFRCAQYLILQATLEQTTYAAMVSRIPHARSAAQFLTHFPCGSSGRVALLQVSCRAEPPTSSSATIAMGFVLHDEDHAGGDVSAKVLAGRLRVVLDRENVERGERAPSR